LGLLLIEWFILLLFVFVFGFSKHQKSLKLTLEPFVEIATRLQDAAIVMFTSPAEGPFFSSSSSSNHQAHLILLFFL